MTFFKKIYAATFHGIMPITHDGVDRCDKACKCCQCGIVAICRPTFDFYGKDGAPLWCDRCMRKHLNSIGVNTDLMPPISDPESNQ